jgi:hypothetical protein
VDQLSHHFKHKVFFEKLVARAHHTFISTMVDKFTKRAEIEFKSTPLALDFASHNLRERSVELIDDLSHELL